MPANFKVLIAYRPFNVDPSLLTTVATESSIQAAYDAIAQAGFEVDVLRIGNDIRDVLLTLDRRKTLIFNYCDGYLDDPTGYDPITQLFEELGFAFTGASDKAIVDSFDKSHVKSILRQHGILTPDWAVCENSAPEGWRHFPAIVKPARQHGSFGITRDSVIDTPEQLEQQIKLVQEQWHQPALVEDFIDGIEYRVSLWGNGDQVEVLPLLSIRFDNEDHHERLKSFITKWADDELSTPMRIDAPAQVEPHIQSQIEESCIAAFKILAMRDYGGIDVRVRGDKAYLIDPNVNADISEVSNYLRTLLSVGVDYVQMLGKIVGFAAERLPNE
jgi:D-alanine-D-alanine ligase